MNFSIKVSASLKFDRQSIIQNRKVEVPDFHIMQKTVFSLERILD